MKALSFRPGWVDQTEPGIPFQMNKGVQVKDQVSQKRLREMGELFTVQAVAERLKVTYQTIHDWIHKGDSRGKKLGHLKVGRHIRVAESQIEDFLRA
jgi:excisionase family DNA binding protein